MGAETLNFYLALGTLALQAGSAGLLILFLFGKHSRAFVTAGAFIRKYGLHIALAMTFIGSALTLFYSEVLGFPPCPLCWWQRVFLYPQVLLFAFALWKRPAFAADFSIILSGAGLLVALYHHALQILPSGSLPCPAEGAVSCAQRFLFEFNYVTFPLMAASLFASLMILMLFVRSR